MQSSELVANLFVECEPSRLDYHGLCKYVCVYCPLMRICSLISSFSSPTALWRNVFLLVLTALTKVFFTAWTFGMMVGGSIGLSSTIHRNAAGPCWNFLTHDCDWSLPREGYRTDHVSPRDRYNGCSLTRS